MDKLGEKSFFVELFFSLPGHDNHFKRLMLSFSSFLVFDRLLISVLPGAFLMIKAFLHDYDQKLVFFQKNLFWYWSRKSLLSNFQHFEEAFDVFNPVTAFVQFGHFGRL